MLKKALLLAGCLLFINICPTPAEAQLPLLLRGVVGRAAVSRGIGIRALSSSVRRPAVVSTGRGLRSSYGYARVPRTSGFSRGMRISPYVRTGVEIFRVFVRTNSDRREFESRRGHDGRYRTWCP